MKQYILFFCLLLLSLNLRSSLAINKKIKWEKFGVTWIVADSKAEPRFAPSAQWNYTELSNYNSIISSSRFYTYNVININTKIFERIKTPA